MTWSRKVLPLADAVEDEGEFRIGDAVGGGGDVAMVGVVEVAEDVDEVGNEVEGVGAYKDGKSLGRSH